ncbi:unnamed protein product [Laminaria digitata]
MSRFVPSSESRRQSRRENRSPPAENKDLEAGVGVVTNTAASPRASSATALNAVGASAAGGARPPAVDLPTRGHLNGGAAAAAATLLPRRSTSTWSGRDLIKKAEGLPRVRVTPAWSLNAALGAMSASSPTTKDASATTASSIVQEVAAARSSGLVICGCAGSGQLPVSDLPSAPAEGANRVGGALGNAPLAGASTVHGKWPSLGPLSRSRHNPTLSTRSWHGKSRQLGRSMHSSRHGAGGARVSGVHGGVRGGGGLASAVDRVLHGALLDIVGDVAGGLVRSEREPAVLAVRASIPVKSATSV